jgi:hypothetical protein
MFLPKIQISKPPMLTNMNELLKIYLEMNRKIKNLSLTKITSLKNIKKQLIFENYLKKLLIDNRLNDFHKIVESEKIFKTCHLVINNILINCSKVDIGVSNWKSDISSFKQFRIINHFNYSQISDKNKIENIILSLNPLRDLFVKLYLSHSNYIMRSIFTPQPNTRTKLTFSTFSLRKLNSFDNKCISDKDLKNFGEDYFDFIFTDCVFKICGCIPIDKFNIQVYFDRDISKNGYKFCTNFNSTNDSTINIIKKCYSNVKPKCNLINFNTKIETTKLASNQTIVEIISKKKPRIAYIETFKTDFDRLIYNGGGVLGLWFGLTPIIAADYLSLILIFIKSKFMKFVRYSKAIIIKFGKNLIRICKIFGIFLIASIISFAYNLTEIYIRFWHHFIGMIATEN